VTLAVTGNTISGQVVRCADMRVPVYFCVEAWIAVKPEVDGTYGG
jgi:hypothetical protein